VKDFIHQSNGKRYYVTHGDIFDSITSNMRWLSKLGDVGYTLLLHINKYYNRYRSLKGKTYFSLAQSVKNKVKSAVSYISDYERSLVDLAKTKHCQGIICGHIHRAENKLFGDIHYLNSGDWVETLSALVENEKGEWSIVYYQDNYKTIEKSTDEPNETELNAFYSSFSNNLQKEVLYR
jgi:UDP-2,3-diacylglucosamine pyrophosphatase LpxH